jgi:hypothetical protein
MGKPLLYFLGVLAICGQLLGIGSHAIAGTASPATVTTVVAESSGFKAVLEFDHPVSAGQAQALQAGLRAPVAAMLQCNRYYEFYDSNGRYTIQHACGSQFAPWSFRMSANIQAIVFGNVSERGLMWKVNGRTMSMQSPHVVAASYLFHGTYNSITANANIQYQDVFTFRHNLGTGGTATLTMTGDHTFTNIPAWVP